jgi:hypothetical protein
MFTLTRLFNVSGGKDPDGKPGSSHVTCSEGAAASLKAEFQGYLN